MPRLQINYSKTIIYKIVCKDINIKECYVGQTTDFTERKSCHKCRCMNSNYKQHNLYVYQFIRENGNWDNWDMIEIEKYNAIDKLDASKKERYWIEQLQATLNKNIPTRTHEEYSKEYYEKNKDKIKAYNELNIDTIKEYQKKYKELNKNKIKEKITCCCGSICRKDGIRSHERTNKHIEFVKTI